MRPVTVLVPLPPSYRGGTEEYAYRVVEQASRVIPVRVVTTNVRWGHDTDPLSIGAAEQVVIPGFELLERPVVLSRAARTTLRRLISDSSLLHIHMPFPMVERWATRWARRAGVPVLLTYHMDARLTRSALGGVATSLYRAISARPALEGAALVVSNSQGYAAASPVLSRQLPKVRVVAKGIDPGRLRFEEGVLPQVPGLNPPSTTGAEADRRILFVGRLVGYKGVPVLIEAIRRLTRAGSRVHLYVAGRGPEEAALRNQVVEADLKTRVTFLGFVPDPLIGSLYRWADVVACPSINMMESTPTSLEEAASVGTPVLGSALPGASESIPSDGVHGLLVAPGSVEAVVAGLRHLLGQPHWTPAHIRTWEDVSQEYLRLYGELVPGLGEPVRSNGLSRATVSSAVGRNGTS
jgi:glycosyltransferase involved in cell wall biosynthesis